MSEEPVDDRESLSVAEAKARFSELIDRVGRGERFIVTRRGKPAVGLIPPSEMSPQRQRPLGLLAGLGALAEWETLEEDMREVVASRRKARDRPPPDLD